jgi:hypothetical protein
VQLAALAAIKDMLTEVAPDLVVSGGAEGWDACLARAAFDLGISYDLLIPYYGYIDHYWRKNSVLGWDRWLDAANMMNRAAKVVVLGQSTQAVCAHSGRVVHANLVRNCLMVQSADLMLAFDPSSRGTAHGLLECRRHDVPFKVWSESGGWGDGPQTVC